MVFRMRECGINNDDVGPVAEFRLSAGRQLAVLYLSTYRLRCGGSSSFNTLDFTAIISSHSS